MIIEDVKQLYKNAYNGNEESFKVINKKVNIRPIERIDINFFVSTRQLAEEGLQLAIIAMGKIFTNYKTPGTVNKYSNTISMEWFLKAIRNENGSAEYYIGMLYYNGIECKCCNNEEDREKAIDWFKKASAKNHTTSQFRLGEIYQNRDFNKGMKWYIKASSNGYKIRNNLLNYTITLYKKNLALEKKCMKQNARIKHLEYEPPCECGKPGGPVYYEILAKTRVGK